MRSAARFQRGPLSSVTRTGKGPRVSRREDRDCRDDGRQAGQWVEQLG
jgi:hypothetical protein